MFQRVLGRWRNTEHAEVTKEARGDWVSTSPRGSTCRTDGHILLRGENYHEMNNTSMKYSEVRQLDKC